LLKAILIPAAAVLCCALIAGVVYYENYNVITFRRGIGLDASRIAKVVVVGGGTLTHYETTDSQKIDAIYNALKDEKLKRHWNPELIQGGGYWIDFYPKQGKGWIRYSMGGSDNFYAFDGYSGAHIQGTYFAENWNEVYQTLRSFYISLGGKPNE